MICIVHITITTISIDQMESANKFIYHVDLYRRSLDTHLYSFSWNATVRKDLIYIVRYAHKDKWTFVQHFFSKILGFKIFNATLSMNSEMLLIYNLLFKAFSDTLVAFISNYKKNITYIKFVNYWLKETMDLLHIPCLCYQLQPVERSMYMLQWLLIIITRLSAIIRSS